MAASSIPRTRLVGACIGLTIFLGHTDAARAVTQGAHAGHVRAEVAPEDLPPARRLRGVGTVSMKVTANREARAWFNQGLNLLHDFWDYESARAFEQGIRSDPTCAMCYWGLYQAESNFHSNEKGYAEASLARAAELEAKVGRAEQLYIEAGLAHVRGQKAGQFKPPEEISKLRELVAADPADTQAKIFLADALQDGYDEKGEPRAGQREAVALLRTVIAADPRNSAAHHYLIHALEAHHPEEAIASAKILPMLAPASAHIVHMPGHIYYLLGHYDQAEKAFAASMELDETYMRQQGVHAVDDWNYVHNLMYAVANLLEEGKVADADRLSMKVSAARGDLESTLYLFSPRDSISRLDPRLPVTLRIAGWADALKALQSKPEEDLANLEFLRRSLIAFATGMEAVEARDIDGAVEASRTLDAELWRTSQSAKELQNQLAPAHTLHTLPVMSDAMVQPLLQYLSVSSLELRGAVRLLENRPDDGKRLFAAASREEKALGYREPPHFVRPVGETEGAALIAAGDWNGALTAYQDALAERPHSGFALFGVALARENSGDIAAATRAYVEFLAAWKEADPTLPELIHAQHYLAEHKKI